MLCRIIVPVPNVIASLSSDPPIASYPATVSRSEHGAQSGRQLSPPLHFLRSTIVQQPLVEKIKQLLLLGNSWQVNENKSDHYAPIYSHHC